MSPLSGQDPPRRKDPSPAWRGSTVSKSTMEGAKKTTGDKRGRGHSGEGGAVRRVETRAAKRRRQETELWDASFAGDLEVVRRSLAEDQSALNKAATTGRESERGDNALICAVRGNQLHVVNIPHGIYHLRSSTLCRRGSRVDSLERSPISRWIWPIQIRRGTTAGPGSTSTISSPPVHCAGRHGGASLGHGALQPSGLDHALL